MSSTGPGAGPGISTTDARPPVPAAPGGLHSWVARRPLTALLVVVAAVGWPLTSLPSATAVTQNAAGSMTRSVVPRANGSWGSGPPGRTRAR